MEEGHEREREAAIKLASIVTYLALVVVAASACKARAPDATVLAVAPTSISSEERSLPSAGAYSYFDRIYYESGAAFPKDFPALIKLLEERFGASVRGQGAEGEFSFGLLVPFGRSLQHTRTNFKQPRVLLRAEGIKFASACAPNPGARLFLGYSEQADVLEIISWNDTDGRFEFQVLRDFSKPKRTLAYAARSACTRCHQGGTPIFPGSFWQETNAAVEGGANPDHVSEQIAAAQEDGATLYQGVPIANAQVNAFSFDRSVRTAAKNLTGQALWGVGCGTPPDTACRRSIVQVALKALASGKCALNGLSKDDPTVTAAQAALVKKFPGGGIGVPNSFLADREPVPFQSLGGELSPAATRTPEAWVKPSPELSDGLFLAAERCGDFGKFDPVVMLDTAAYLKGDGRIFLSPAEVDALKVAVTQARVAGPSRLDHPALQRIYRTSTLNKNEFIEGVAMAFDAPVLAEKARECARPSAQVPTPKLALLTAADGLSPEDRASPVRLFRHYCGPCHAGEEALGPEFMNEADDAVLWTKLTRDATVFRRLESGSMPPPGSVGTTDAAAFAGDRRVMLQALQTALR